MLEIALWGSLIGILALTGLVVLYNNEHLTIKQFQRTALPLVLVLGLGVGLLWPNVSASRMQIPFCEDPSSRAVLDSIQGRLDPALDFRFSLEVAYLDRGDFFAYASNPDQQVVLTVGMLKASHTTPRFLSGVVAHELGHLVLEDRSQRAYWPPIESRRQEELAADSLGVELLDELGYGSRGLVQFLQRAKLQAQASRSTPGWLPARLRGWMWGRIQNLSTHPPADKRIRRLRPLVSSGAPLVTQAEFQALQRGCQPSRAKRLVQ